MTGGKASRQKGDRQERKIVSRFQAEGIAAERIPLSGSVGGSFCGDISVPILGHDRRFESKVRSRGFQLLYSMMADHYGLIVAQDRAEPLVVLRLDRAIDLIKAAEAGKSSPVSQNKAV